MSSPQISEARKRTYIALAVFSSMMVLVLGCPSTESNKGNEGELNGSLGVWPTLGGNSGHTGLSLTPGPEVPKVAWRLDLRSDCDWEGAVASSIALSTDTIHLCLYRGYESEDGKPYWEQTKLFLIAITPSGEKLWETELGKCILHLGIRVSPAIGIDGTVIAPSSDGLVHALSTDGSLIWSFNTISMLDCTPTVAENGTVYISDEGASLFAITRHGDMKWSFPLNDTNRLPRRRLEATANSPPCDIDWDRAGRVSYGSAGVAIGSDGTVYWACSRRLILAITEDGSEKWRITLPEVKRSREVDRYAWGSYNFGLGPEGSVYAAIIHTKQKKIVVVTEEGELYVIDESGNLEYTQLLDRFVDSTPCVDSEGNVYVATREGLLYCIEPGVGTRWIFCDDSDNSLWGLYQPIVDISGRVYVGGEGRYYCVGPDGELIWVLQPEDLNIADWFRTQGAIGADGTLYIVTNSCVFFAVHE